MDCIVLVKQVPDVSNIPEDAWDREKGTLRRGMLDSILNPAAAGDRDRPDVLSRCTLCMRDVRLNPFVVDRGSGWE